MAKNNHTLLPEKQTDFNIKTTFASTGTIRSKYSKNTLLVQAKMRSQYRVNTAYIFIMNEIVPRLRQKKSLLYVSLTRIH